MKNPVGSKLILPGEHLPESVGDYQAEDETVTVVLRLSEPGMCVVQRQSGEPLEVSDDCLWEDEVPWSQEWEDDQRAYFDAIN